MGLWQKFFTFIEELMVGTEEKKIIPIIGLPGCGKTFFLLSLTKWIFDGITDREEIVLEGREYINKLLFFYNSIKVESNHCITSDIQPTPLGEVNDVQLLLPKDIINGLNEDIHIFTKDAPGELLSQNNISELTEIFKNIKGLIFLIDIFKDDFNQNEINWDLVEQDAAETVQIVSELVMPSLDDDTPVALVVTKADRRRFFKEFQEKDKIERQKNIEFILKRLKHTYMPLVKQRNVEMFFHSSVGDYTSIDEAFDKGKEFPKPYGINNILLHCLNISEDEDSNVSEDEE